jgi:RNA polymerase sigma factor (sigma-70 family)
MEEFLEKNAHNSHHNVEMQVELSDFRSHLLTIMSLFHPKHQELIHMLYWEDLNQPEIAEKWKCSKQAINQMVKRVINKLRNLVPVEFQDLLLK